MWWWIFFSLFFLISVGSSILLFFALKRINNYDNLILEFQRIIQFSTEKMKQIDESGHFEADDEVGFFFQQLKELQELLNGIFENENEESSGAEEKEKS